MVLALTQMCVTKKSINFAVSNNLSLVFCSIANAIRFHLSQNEEVFKVFLCSACIFTVCPGNNMYKTITTTCPERFWASISLIN